MVPFPLLTRLRRIIGHFGIAGRRLVSAVRVREDQLVLARRVPKKVIDTFLLHQAADEVEVGFAILNEIFPRAILGRQRLDEIREPVLAKDRFYDLRDGLILEDAAVVGLIEQPEPGAELRAIAHVST